MTSAPEAPQRTAETGTDSPMVEESRTTSRQARWLAVAGWVVLLLAWSAVIGIPSDAIGIMITFWLLTIAWNIQAPWRTHLGYARDWAWPAALLTIYFYSRGWLDNLGIPVSYEMPIKVDQWMFGGTLPTTTLQDAWCGDPCSLETATHHWYDTALTAVYSSHFLVGMTLAVVLWARNREEWLVWMRRYIGLNFAGLVVYTLYPMAPPWLAAKEGYAGAEGIGRITALGSGDFGLERTNIVLNGVGNPVAAMPSLHVGTAALVTAYAIWRLRSPWRWLLVLYPLTMSLALVYFGEHYVIDEIAGAALAVAVMVAASAWERWRRRRTDAEAQQDALAVSAG